LEAHIQGSVAAGFEPVAEAFRRNFENDGEEAAAVSVYWQGTKVVDLWGGTDFTYERPMPANGLMMIASCSKGVTATILGILIDRGILDPERTVSSYWPEYAVAGKSGTTVAMVAAHTAGLPFPPPGSGLKGLDFQRGPALADILASAAPLYEPGTAMTYHAFTVGTLLNEIVLRASGKSIAQLIQDELAAPLGLDMWLGLPEARVPQVVPGRWKETSPMVPTEEALPPGSFAELRRASLLETPPVDPDFFDTNDVRANYAAERPAVGVITDARSLARMYAATLGPVDGVQLFSPDTLRVMTTPRTGGLEALIEAGTAGPDLRFGLGYQLPTGSFPGLGPESFGHNGAGARIGYADTRYQVALGYLCSQMRNIGPDGDPRWTQLASAIRSCVA
jgi:CubicO group peptidase (beta-lactamase class C family)